MLSCVKAMKYTVGCSLVWRALVCIGLAHQPCRRSEVEVGGNFCRGTSSRQTLLPTLIVMVSFALIFIYNRKLA
jgi:hypothetical protein